MTNVEEKWTMYDKKKIVTPMVWMTLSSADSAKQGWWAGFLAPEDFGKGYKSKTSHM